VQLGEVAIVVAVFVGLPKREAHRFASSKFSRACRVNPGEEWHIDVIDFTLP
jgi:hypothetical protein